jgi:hypothetical protein
VNVESFLKRVVVLVLLTAAWFAHSERSAGNQASNSVVIIPQPKLVRTGAGKLKIGNSAKWSLTSNSLDERLWEAAKQVIHSENGDFRSGSDWTVIQIGARRAEHDRIISECSIYVP